MLPFDEAAALYKADPEAFEKYRCNSITTLLHSILEQRGEEAERRAKALQWKIDVMRNRWHLPNLPGKTQPTEKEIAKNQLLVLQKINALMVESLKELGAKSSKLIEVLNRGH